MLTVLRNRPYRRLFSAQVLSLLGTGLTTVALGLLAYDLAGANAGAVLGTALALKMVAYVGISPIAGAVAAKLPRRPFLVSLDLCRASLVLFLPFVTAAWQIYALVFLFQSFSACFTPTFQATIPDVVREEEAYTEALSLSRLAYDLESLLSPLLAGLLLAFVSFHWLFAGTTLGYLASAALVLSVALPRAAASQREMSFRDRLTRGLWIYFATPRLRGLLACCFAVACAGAMVIVNTVVYVREELGGTDQDVALLFAAYGCGSMMVALALPRLLRRIEPRPAVLTGAALLAVLLSAAAPGWGYAASLPLWLCLGAGVSLVLTPAGLLLRRSVWEEDRPAIFAAQFCLSHACYLFAYPVAGWLGSAAGLTVTFGVMACGALAGFVAAWRLWPAADPAELWHEHPAMEHDHTHEHDEHHQHAHDGWEGPAPHRHPHRHGPLRHRHVFVIDDHHPVWPRG